MITDIIALPLFLLVLRLVPGYCAHEDAFAVHRNNEGGITTPLPHDAPWRLRAVVMGAICAIWCIRYGPMAWPPLALMCIGGFPSVFRFDINRLRSTHTCYLSPTSKYDWAYISVRTLLLRGKWPEITRAEAIKRHHDLYIGPPPDAHYVQMNHKAGRDAYIVEGALFAVGLFFFGKLWLAHLVAHQ